MLMYIKFFFFNWEWL